MKFSAFTLLVSVLTAQAIAAPGIDSRGIEKRCNRNKGVCNANTGLCDDIGGGGSIADATCVAGGNKVAADTAFGSAASKAGTLCNRNKGQCDGEGNCADIGGGGSVPDPKYV
ncbi:hypothetical protein DL95DRAFT_417983 [Leptodontidium sp. 2 PMI_412]|nr:hypothetical protein DL95DRAFT_417983 [Leptodontidium sp. 2 PMI_412]